MQWIALIWAQIALWGSLAGVVALWWYWPSWWPRAPLVAAVAALAAFGWGEKRFGDGREGGAAHERAQWEQSVRDLKADLAGEKQRAEERIRQIAERATQTLAERNEAREQARLANARLIAEIGRESESETVTCEGTNEQIECPRCPSCYGQRIDSRILRNLAAGRGQN